MSYFGDVTRALLKPLIEPAVKAEIAALPSPVIEKGATATDVGPAQFLGFPFTSPKRKEGASVDFDTLRTFSVVYDVARACINHRKRQISGLEWNIVPKDPKANAEARKKDIEKLENFFAEPAFNTDFRTFADKIIEDLLVLDAVVLWKDRTFGNELKELINVDGSTIRLRVTQDGTLPPPPAPAYQQIIRGEVKGEYTTEEIYYKIMNPRTNSPYGLSPMESLVIGVDSALKSQMYNAAMLSEGTVPEGFFGVPETWTAEQIKDFQMWFDSVLAGNFGQTSRIKFMPGGKGVGYMPTKKAEDMRYLEFEKWLLLKTCALFEIQPQEIGYIEDVNRSNSEQQGKIGNERGLVPTANFVKALLNEIIRRDFGITDLKFEWLGLNATDDKFELERADKMIERGAMTIDEMRSQQGMDPFNTPESSQPIIHTSSGPMLLSDISLDKSEDEEEEVTPAKEEKEEPKDEVKDEIQEMANWEKKVSRALKQGKPVPGFTTEHIDRSAVSLIRAQLVSAKNPDDVKKIFKPFRAELEERALVSRALNLSKDASEARIKRHVPARQNS